MPRRRSERGEGNLGCILWLLALGLAALIAWKAVPVKIQSTELYDYMDELAKFSAARTPPDEHREGDRRPRPAARHSARQGGRQGRAGRGPHLHGASSYTVPVEFPGYTYQWHFHQKLDRPIFIV